MQLDFLMYSTVAPLTCMYASYECVGATISMHSNKIPAHARLPCVNE